MAGAEQIYQLLRQRARSAASIDSVLLGINWTLVSLAGEIEKTCATERNSLGLCFSPVAVPRNLPWSGTLAGRRAQELIDWLECDDSGALAVALATCNASLNTADNPLLCRALPVACEQAPQLSVFEHFAGQLGGARVAVIGRYPGIERYRSVFDFVCIERRPGAGDLPATAAADVLPRSDWVFITASSIANKTLPHLLALSRNARVVLMGPSMPWLAEWADFGVDYLAGIEVLEPGLLHRVVAEAGGTRIFDSAVRYRILSFL